MPSRRLCWREQRRERHHTLPQRELYVASDWLRPLGTSSTIAPSGGITHTIVVSLLIPMPISTLLAPAMTGLDIRLHACFQVSPSAALEVQRQIAAHIAVCKLATGVGFIVG